MRKLYVLSVILLAIVLSGIQPQSASAGVCPASHLTCAEVDSYVEICYGGARTCTVYQCSGGASYTCCTPCEGPFYGRSSGSAPFILDQEGVAVVDVAGSLFRGSPGTSY